jgi:hypothetical protein
MPDRKKLKHVLGPFEDVKVLTLGSFQDEKDSSWHITPYQQFAGRWNTVQDSGKENRIIHTIETWSTVSTLESSQKFNYTCKTHERPGSNGAEYPGHLLAR